MAPVKKKSSKKSPLRTYIEGLDPEAPFGRTNPHVIKIAAKAKISVEALYRVSRGDYKLRAANAMALSKATGGAVSAAHLAGLE
jgi:hypothetical protein